MITNYWNMNAGCFINNETGEKYDLNAMSNGQYKVINDQQFWNETINEAIKDLKEKINEDISYLRVSENANDILNSTFLFKTQNYSVHVDKNLENKIEFYNDNDVKIAELNITND